MRRSRELSAARLPSMSKIPPNFRETFGARCERATSLSNSVCHFRMLEDSLAGAKHFVERLLKISSSACEVGANLRDVFLVALFYFVAK